MRMFKNSCRLFTCCQQLIWKQPGLTVRSFATKCDYFDDPGAPRIALCKDGRTIAMYHPEEKIAYEKTIAIPRDDPRYSFSDVETLVQDRLHDMDMADRAVEGPSLTHMFPMYDRDVVPTVMGLATMFHTSKHRWFRTKKKIGRKMFRIPQ